MMDGRMGWELAPPPDLDPRLDRRRLLARGIALAIGAVPGASLLAACGRDGEMGPSMPDWMMGEGTMGPEMMEDMRVIRALLLGHERIGRRVVDVDAGIRARTTSEDPEIAELIQAHVRRMRDRIEEGDPIRLMDPVFRELFEHHEAIAIQVEEIPSGVVVVETSADPQVELLIRQYAHRAVSEFVSEGMTRAMRPTPLPPRYRG